MLFNKELLESILSYIGKRLNHEVECLMIGGNAMIYYGLREQTKDSDIVFFERKDLASVIQIILSHRLYKKAKILRQLPYAINPELLKKGEPTVIGNKDLPRFDLFYKFVFRVDAKEILNEAKRSIRFDLLKLKLAEVEHLIFLKAVSARPLDFEDIILLSKNVKINWKLLVDFIKKYYKQDHRPIFFALGTFYDINKKEKIIPEFVTREIGKLFEE